MRPNPSDLTQVVLMIAGALVLAVTNVRLVKRYQARTPRLRLLTGTRPQHAALRVALAPVVREFLPLLKRAGLDVRAIAVVPTLSGSDGEPLVAAVEQLSGSAAFIVRLAHRLGATVRQPDDMAEDLLYLYRHAAAVTVVRQTPPAAALAAVAHEAGRHPSPSAEMDWRHCRATRHKTKPRRP